MVDGRVIIRDSAGVAKHVQLIHLPTLQLHRQEVEEDPIKISTEAEPSEGTAATDAVGLECHGQKTVLPTCQDF